MRISWRELGEAVHLSPTSAADRVRRMERDGVIQGYTVRVDPTSAQYLRGIEIDYVSSLSGGGFKFINPNAKHTCGCGSSFSA